MPGQAATNSQVSILLTGPVRGFYVLNNIEPSRFESLFEQHSEASQLLNIAVTPVVYDDVQARRRRMRRRRRRAAQFPSDASQKCRIGLVAKEKPGALACRACHVGARHAPPSILRRRRGVVDPRDVRVWVQRLPERDRPADAKPYLEHTESCVAAGEAVLCEERRVEPVVPMGVDFVRRRRWPWRHCQRPPQGRADPEEEEEEEAASAGGGGGRRRGGGGGGVEELIGGRFTRASPSDHHGAGFISVNNLSVSVSFFHLNPYEVT